MLLRKFTLRHERAPFHDGMNRRQVLSAVFVRGTKNNSLISVDSLYTNASLQVVDLIPMQKKTERFPAMQCVRWRQTSRKCLEI